MPRQATLPGMGGRGDGLSRRQLLQLTGMGGAGLALTGAGSSVAATRRTTADAVAFNGPHQAGIATPQQRHVELAAFDVVTDQPQVLASLLATWTDAARAMAAGQLAGPPGSAGKEPPDDAETLGLRAARLTVTVGFGPSLFAPGRFVFAGTRPAALADLPSFPTDHLQPQWCGGDLMVQACADDPTVALHAVRTLLHHASGQAVLRWSQSGFLSTPPDHTAPRNLLGFREGAGNVHSDDARALAEHVWVGAEGPAWMRGGSYAVIRRIRLRLDDWDEASLDEQEHVIGRRKVDGAPLGLRRERSALPLDGVDRGGKPLIPANAHVRLAAAQTNGGARLLRRGYNYSGTARDGQLEAGLLFICFQRDPRTAFVPIQQRLATSDALNEYLRHEGSAVFAVPGGLGATGSWGDRLLPGIGTTS